MPGVRIRPSCIAGKPSSLRDIPTFQFTDDVAGLEALGYHAQGWDPYYAKGEPKIRADVVNLGFVLVVDHSEGATHQILFFKERFLPAEYPGREGFEQYSKRLRKLGIHEGLLGPNDQGAPSREEFESALEQVGLTRGLARKPKPRSPAA